MRFRANLVCPFRRTRFSPCSPSVLWGFAQTKCAHFEQRGFHPISIGAMRFRANKVCPLGTTRFSPYFHRCYEVSSKQNVPISKNEVFTLFPSVLWGFAQTKCAHFEQRGFHPISIGAMRFRANIVCPLGIGMFSVYFALCYEVSNTQSVPISNNEVHTLFPSVLWGFAQTKCAHFEQRGFHNYFHRCYEVSRKQSVPIENRDVFRVFRCLLWGLEQTKCAHSEWGCFPCISLSAMRFRAHKMCPFRRTRFSPYFHRCYEVSRKQSVSIGNGDVFRVFRCLLWGLEQTKCAHSEWGCFPCILVSAMRFRGNKVCPFRTTRFTPFFHRCYEVSRKQSVPISNNEVHTLFPSVLWGFAQTKCAHFEERGFHPISIGAMRFRANKVCPFRIGMFSVYFALCYEVSSKQNVPISKNEVFTLFPSVLWSFAQTKCAHWE